jgi:hypothetical protein
MDYGHAFVSLTCYRRQLGSYARAGLEMDLSRARSRFCKIFRTWLSSENYAIDQRRGDRLEPGGYSTPRGIETYLFTSCDRYLSPMDRIIDPSSSDGCAKGRGSYKARSLRVRM